MGAVGSWRDHLDRRPNTKTDVPTLAAAFDKKQTKKHLEQVERLLETLGQAEEVEEGVWGR